MQQRWINPRLCEYELTPEEVAAIVTKHLAESVQGEVSQVVAFDQRWAVRSQVPTLLVYVQRDRT